MMKKILFFLFVLAIVLFPQLDVRAEVENELCPETGNGWYKIDDLSGYSFTVTAPTGQLIIESCYKASVSVKYETYDPPVQEVTITSTILNPGGELAEISHISVRLIPVLPPPPTVVITPTETGEPGITPTVTETGQPGATPTVTETGQPGVTPTATTTGQPDVTPTSTGESGETPQVTETPGGAFPGAPTGAAFPISAIFFFFLGGIMLLLAVKFLLPKKI